ncbi:hypothetical protein bcgnr5380_60950 [Bacillus cereus]
MSDCRSGARQRRLLKLSQTPPTVIPAKAGIQRLQSLVSVKPWMFGSAEVKQSPPSRE